MFYPPESLSSLKCENVFVFQVMSLEVDHGVYVGPGGRINVSSLTEAAAKQVADAVIAVVK
jgi:aspartate/tyrosine/aromatic aminotransferase